MIRDSDWQSVYIIDEIARFQEQNASAVILATLYGTQRIESDFPHFDSAEPGRAVWPIQERVLKRTDLNLHIPVFQIAGANCSGVLDRLKAIRDLNVTATASMDRVGSIISHVDTFQ